MVQVGAYHQAAGYYNSSVKNQTKAASSDSAKEAGAAGRKKETELSSRAQDVLKRLRSKYGDMDIMAADFKKGKEAKEILSGSSKEFAVLFSNDELEKMASDEAYFEKKVGEMEGAVRMSKQINERFEFEQGLGVKGTENATLAKTGIAFNDDGTTSFFAELEKSSAKQKERIEAAREEKRSANKTEKELASYAKNSADVKRKTVWADSMEKLLEKIKKVNWNAANAENKPASGRNYDFSI